MEEFACKSTEEDHYVRLQVGFPTCGRWSRWFRLGTVLSLPPAVILAPHPAQLV